MSSFGRNGDREDEKVEAVFEERQAAEVREREETEGPQGAAL